MLFIVTITCMVFSCDYGANERLEPNIEIQNQELRNAILEYDSLLQKSVPNEKYLLTVYERNYNDSLTRFSISYSLDTWAMQSEPILLAKVGAKYVVLYTISNNRGVLITDKLLHKKITRLYFPEEYKLMNQGKQLEISTNIDAPWIELIFCKNKLKSKKTKGLDNGKFHD